MPITVRTVVAAVLALAAFPAAAQSRLEPGEWEVTSSTEIPGSYMGPIEQTERRCYTTSDAKLYADKDAWAADMVAATDQNCRAKDLKQSGTALSVTLLCDGDTRIDLLHDFQGATGSMQTRVARGQEPGTKSTYALKRVAEKCSPDTIEQWKAWHPGQTFAP